MVVLRWGGWAGFNPFGQEESRKYSRGEVARLL